ncbi:type VII secretion target [Nonomuraea muscovyensis]|uniref:type VII secretion target n=1 Tax=Nonomuraea muscovyensis TaxID=1124761 RepID=UPI00340376A8
MSEKFDGIQVAFGSRGRTAQDLAEVADRLERAVALALPGVARCVGTRDELSEEFDTECTGLTEQMGQHFESIATHLRGMAAKHVASEHTYVRTEYANGAAS